MKNFKTLKYLFTTLIIVFASALMTFAGTGRIEFTDIKRTPVTRGKVFNISCKIKSDNVRVKSADITVSYDANKIEFIEEGSTNAEGGAGTIRMNGTGFGNSSGTRTLEFQLKFRALAAGDTEIKCLTNEVKDTTDNLVNITKVGTSSIRINPANTQSKNANLKTLNFSPGELNREFDPSVLSYDTEVNVDVERLDIDAHPEDEDATVAESGNENFQIGMNKVTIDVTAPDGKTKKQYVINVTKLENGVTNGTTTIVNGQKFESKSFIINVMSKPENVPIPSGYEELLYDGGEVLAYASKDDISAGIEPKMYLFYGMDATGNKGFYRYDKEYATLQRYVPESNSENNEKLKSENADLKAKYDSVNKKYGIVFPVTIILVALVILLIIILIVMIVRGGSNRRGNEYEMDDEDDDDYFSAKPRRISEPRVNDTLDDDDLDDEFEIDNKKETFNDKYDDKFNQKAEDNSEDDYESEIEDLG